MAAAAKLLGFVDPRVPYAQEKQRGGTAYWWLACAFCAIAWQLLAVAAILWLILSGLRSEFVGWPTTARWLLVPSGVFGAIAGMLSLFDYLYDDPFRWQTPESVLRAAGPGFKYAFGLGGARDDRATM